jgi:predicted RNase H-like HicB family nuclease
MKFKVILEPQDRGYTVYVPALRGCISQGETKKEALKNIKEAIELYLETLEDLGLRKEKGRTKIQTETIEIAEVTI